MVCPVLAYVYKLLKLLQLKNSFISIQETIRQTVNHVHPIKTAEGIHDRCELLFCITLTHGVRE